MKIDKTKNSDLCIEIKLFVPSKYGLLPTSNDVLAQKIEQIINIQKKYTFIMDDGKKIMDRISKYYRAVGILLFRAISLGNLIPHHVLSILYQNG